LLADILDQAVEVQLQGWALSRKEAEGNWDSTETSPVETQKRENDSEKMTQKQQKCYNEFYIIYGGNVSNQ